MSALILDKYVDDCALVSTDFGEPDHESGRNIARVVAPQTPNYPTDIDWNSIGHRLMYELLSLPNAADKVVAKVDGAFGNDEDSGLRHDLLSTLRSA